MGEDMNDHDLLIRMDATLQEMKKNMDVMMPQMVELQNGRTQNQVNISNIQKDVRDLESKGNIIDAIIGTISLIAAALAAFIGFAK